MTMLRKFIADESGSAILANAAIIGFLGTGIFVALSGVDQNFEREFNRLIRSITR